MKLALLSCENLPGWEKDDRFLHQELSRQGIDWKIVSWDASEDWACFDAVLIRTTWDYVERKEQFLETLTSLATQTRLLNPLEVVRWNVEKTYLQTLSAHGLPIAPTIWIDQITQPLSTLLLEQGWTKAFLKPVVGACASDTRRFSIGETEDVEAWLQTQLTSGKRMMLQPYVDTVETEGEYSVLYFGNRLSHCVQKIPVVGDYRVQDDFGATDHRIEAVDHPDLIAIAQRTLSVLQALFDDILVLRLDFLRWDGQFVINELELIEPSLFLRHAPNTGPSILVEELQQRIGYSS